MATYLAGLAGSGINGYFIDSSSNPKFMLLEQCWALPWNAGRWNSGNWQSDMDAYFSTRASQGYAAWYGVAWQSPGVDTSGDNAGRTWDGIYPFLVNGTAGPITSGSQTVTLNSSFWTRLDYMFASALTNGITCFMNAGGLSYDYSSPGVFTNVSTTQMSAIGAALTTRYPQSSYPNVFWFFGDDEYGTQESYFSAMLTGMQGAGDTRALISDENLWEENSHIQFNNGSIAYPGGFGITYATFNWVYSYIPCYVGIEDSYTETGTTLIPVIQGDGVYYGDTDNSTNDYTIRRHTWWALSSGARGLNNTCGPSGSVTNTTWQWGSGAVASLTTDPNGTWITGHIKNVISYFTSLKNWYKLIPDTGSVLVTSGRGTRATPQAPGWSGHNYGDTDTYVCASRVGDGSLAVIYCASHFSITIDQTKMAFGYTATWVDPANLATTSATPGSTYSSSGLGNNSAGNPDWVLVLAGPVGVQHSVMLRAEYTRQVF